TAPASSTPLPPSATALIPPRATPAILPSATATVPPAPLPPTATARPSATATVPPTRVPPTATARRPPATATPRPASVTPAPAGSARYVFPVQPLSAVLHYEPYHHDYPATDIFCPIGSRFVAPTSGVVDFVSPIDRWN